MCNNFDFIYPLRIKEYLVELFFELKILLTNKIQKFVIFIFYSMFHFYSKYNVGF